MTPEEKRAYNARLYRRNKDRPGFMEKKRRQVAERRRRIGATPEYREAMRVANLKYKYGLTIEDYNTLVASNRDGRCPICKLREANAVDHDHATGKVRGYLCKQCNASLGGFFDDPAILSRAARYLKKHP